ncbi:MAG: hypothetical protein C4520_14675 [Candidatus Abyssobacteria bacterium SURF_5]|uniref:Uncharacterized protein n=1 Tax=Abyssobacteria bacterium (strain SURF_5) TaxID=2093360 RepID=A0A3A4NBA1_ABYX5|nr:MAG: hypothetical protein C4520_14675 [Candidatus Abyssubacteria bacterium SURF_5]
MFMLMLTAILDFGSAPFLNATALHKFFPFRPSSLQSKHCFNCGGAPLFRLCGCPLYYLGLLLKKLYHTAQKTFDK